MYVQQLGEIVPPPSHSNLGYCNQITHLILFYFSSRLVTLLKVNDVPIQVYNIFYLTVSSKILNLTFRHAFFLFLKCLAASRLSLFRLSTLLWLGSCTHCSLPSFFWSNKFKQYLSKQRLCCFNSCKPRHYLAEVLIFSLMFSQALFMSSSSLKFPQSCKPVCKLNLIVLPNLQLIQFPEIKSIPCVACLLNAKLSLTFATTR